MTVTAANDRHLALSEAAPVDVGRCIVRVPRAIMEQRGFTAGAVVAVTGEGGTAYARAVPARGSATSIALEKALRDQAGLSLGSVVDLQPARTAPAVSVTLSLADQRASRILGLRRLIRQHLEHKPVAPGLVVSLRLVGGRTVTARISKVDAPAGCAPLVTADTMIELDPAQGEVPRPGVSYEDLGGLDAEIERVREIVEGPLKYPDLFASLGIDPPRGVLLAGPPGTGKTLLARAVAEEAGAAFFHIAGPEIASKHFGESERQLRDVFQRAEKKAPSIIFIDEIDAIAPKRESLSGEKQVERRVVAQLLTLLDGLQMRGQVIVMAATNLPDSLDGALRRPGRFDREVVFRPPSVDGRTQILAVHSRGMPLADDVKLADIAAMAHGFVGADLAALCREAGMSALRRLLGDADAREFGSATVTRDDFLSALGDVEPTALRELYTERPSVTFADIGGQDEAKRELEESVILPLQHPDLVARCGVDPARGVLLAGPPGTGKTLLAKALAGEAKANFISVQGSEVVSQFFGEAERMLRDLFAKARMSAPCIIFVDELDGLAPRRGQDAGVMDRVVGQLLTELDGVRARPGVILVAATNRLGGIDPALTRPGRIDRIIRVGLPDMRARLAILRLHLSGKAVADDLDLSALADTTDGFSGADLELVVRTAALAALRRTLKRAAEDPDVEVAPITAHDLERAVGTVTVARMAIDGEAG